MKTMGTGQSRWQRLRRRAHNFAFDEVPIDDLGSWNRRSGSQRNVYDDPISQLLAEPGKNVTSVLEDRRRHVILGSAGASVVSLLLLGFVVPSMGKDMAAHGHGVRVVETLTEDGLVHLLLWVTLMATLAWSALAWQTSRGPDGELHAPFFDATVGEANFTNVLVLVSFGIGGVALMLLVLLVLAQLIGVLVALVFGLLELAFFIAVLVFIFRRFFGRR